MGRRYREDKAQSGLIVAAPGSMALLCFTVSFKISTVLLVGVPGLCCERSIFSI